MRRLVLASLMLASACGSTASYKYTKPPMELPSGKTEGLTAEEQQVDDMMKKIMASNACGPLFERLVPDAIVVFTDHPGLTYTAHVDANGCKLELGTKGTPEYILPVDTANAQALLDMMEDGVISDEERYRVHHVTYVAGLNANFRMNALYREDVARALALPPVIHLTLLNPSGYEYRGSKEPRAATALLENNIWRVMEGHQGTPGLKLEVTVAKVEEQLNILYGMPGVPEYERLAAYKRWMDSVTVK